MKTTRTHKAIVIVITISFFTGLVVQENIRAEQEILPDSIESPIGKFFSIKKIIWTFDDYQIQADHHPPHKGFVNLSEMIVKYGGHVNIMIIFTSEKYTSQYNNEIRNYSVIDEFGWSEEKINASLEFFQRPNIYPQSHGWNHSENINYANLSYAQTIINFTFWNLKNNYNFTPSFYIGHSGHGNYNITLAMQQFSENNWIVYSEYFRLANESLFPDQVTPAVPHLRIPESVAMFDPLFGCAWGEPCQSFSDAKKLFNSSINGKDIIHIRGHPRFLNGSDQRATENLSFWQQWIDWIYQNHDLINMNHTQAIHYLLDKENIRVIKNSETEFVIDLSDCSYDHEILFTKMTTNESKVNMVYDNNENVLGAIEEDTFLKLNHGQIFIYKESNREDATALNISLEIALFLLAVLCFFAIVIVKKFMKKS